MPPRPHGALKYQKEGCKCEVCRAGQRERVADQRERRKLTLVAPLADAPDQPTDQPTVTRSRRSQSATDARSASTTRPREGRKPVAPRVAPDVATDRVDQADAVDAGATAGIEMPHLWQTSGDEPAYGESHRELLAWYAQFAVANPDTVYVFPPDDMDSKQEAKDIERLLKKFKSANPGLIDYRGDPASQKWFTYYKFDVFSAEYVAVEAENDPEETDDEPVSEPTMPGSPVITPVITPVSSTVSRKVDYEFINNTHGMCQVKLSTDEMYCRMAVEIEPMRWKYTVSGKPVCQDHYNAIRADFPERCKYMNSARQMVTAPKQPRSVNNSIAPSVADTPVRNSDSRYGRREQDGNQSPPTWG